MTTDREQRLDEIIAEYLQAQEAGVSKTPDILIADNPEFVQELREFFDDLGQFEQIPSPLAIPQISRKPVLGKLRYFGNYELLEEIARGGMGIVYKAKQVSLNRIVAVKMIVTGSFASDDDLKRFQAEAEAAANLRHPNIVSVHEVGCHAGQHYFSMEFIDGKNLTEIARDNPLPAQKAARYARDIAIAIHYAHQEGTLHRDVKPSNVLIDQDDSVQITDFGLAMRVEGDSELTRTGQILGTPSYMPPEQAQLKRDLIGPASDVYSIGALLYELLTGRPPFRAETPVEALRQVIDSSPVSPRLLNPSIPIDLETVCLKCLEKEPHRRYVTAQLLADDLECFLIGEPISARPIGRVAKAWRWCRRRPVVAGLSALVAILFVTIFCVSTASFFITRSAWRVAEDNAIELERNLYFSEMTRGGHAALDPDGLLQVSRIVDRWGKPLKEKWQGWEWSYLNSLVSQEVATLRGHQGNVIAAAWSPDGKVLASAGEDGTIKLWSEMGKLMHEFRGEMGSVSALEWIHNGSQIATAVEDGSVQIRNTESGELLETFTRDTVAVALAWHQEYQLLAIAYLDPANSAGTSVISIRDGMNWKESHLGTINGRCLQLQWHPTKPLVGAADASGKITVWNSQTKSQANEYDGHAFQWNFDGSLLATRVFNKLHISKTDQDPKLFTFQGDDRGDFAWHPSDPILAYSNRRRLVKLFDVRSGIDIHTMRGDQLQNIALCWHPQGHRIATCGVEGELRIWDASRPAELTPGSATISWSPDGSKYVSRIRNKLVIYDRAESKSAQQLGQHRYTVYSVSWSPDGKMIASASYDGEIRICDAASGKVKISIKVETVQSRGVSRLPGVLAWSPDSRRLAFPHAENKIGIVNVQSEQLNLFNGHSSRLRCIAWAPSGGVIASSSDKGGILIWDPVNLEIVLPIKSTPVNSISWEPAGTRLAGACGDGNTRLWDSKSGNLIHALYGHVTYVQSVAWHPDGTRIASAAESGDILVWDAATGNQALILKYDGGVPMIEWSPNGNHLAAVGYGGNAAVRIWGSVPSSSASQIW